MTRAALAAEDRVVPEHCEQGDCQQPVATWCPLCGSFLCAEHDELVAYRGHDCLAGPAD